VMFCSGCKTQQQKLEELGAVITVNEQSEIVEVFLDDSKIKDAGLMHLEGLNNLKTLNLGDRRITDAGLVHLEGLNNLQILMLSDTKITDTGVAKLKRYLPNCTIAAFP